jgi:flagellar M-ring protein FliF
VDGILNLLRSLGSTRVVIMGVVLAGLLGFFAYLTLEITKPPMALLYSNLDIKDSGAIAGKLTAMNVPFNVSPDGASIMVPSDETAKLRMAMAQDGLPAGGTVGYEIFDETKSLGTTSFVQNINHLRALEGELARSIQSIDRVTAARVHLVLPERRLFSQETEKPTASIIVRTQGRLSDNYVAAIQHLVAAAVPDLDPGRISIVDERGNLLAAGTESNNGQAFASNADERRLAYEAQMKAQLETLLANSLGPGKVRAQVTAEIDFDRVTTNSETYDPDSQVVRSQQSTEEAGSNTERDKQSNDVTVANNLPEADVANNDAPASAATNNRTQETVNYEISKTVRTETQEAGRLKRLSVAILVDGTYQTAADGTKTYAPRSDDELKKIESLVKSAIGFNAERGDVVNVVNMQFAEVQQIEPVPTPASILGMDRQDFFRLMQLVVMAVVSALVILLVVRPLLVRILEALPTPQPRVPALPGAPQMAALPAGEAYALAGGEPYPATGNALVPAGTPGVPAIDLSSIVGRMQESPVNKIGEVVQRHPEEAASILRNWLYNE